MADGDRQAVTIYRGVTTARAGTGESGPPTSGQTITLWSSTGDTVALPLAQPSRFTRITLNIVSSHDSAAGGVIVEQSADGSQWDAAALFPQTYSAAGGESVYDLFISKPHVRFRYINSANTLTKWQVELRASTGDRARL